MIDLIFSFSNKTKMLGNFPFCQPTHFYHKNFVNSVICPLITLFSMFSA